VSTSPDRATRNTAHKARNPKHATRFTFHVSRLSCRVSFPVVCCLLLATCSFPGSVTPTVKIGLSAPFEGLYRDRGYEALHAVRLAVRQRNEAGGLGGRYLIEIVALNDFGEPQEALVQAHKMAVDSGVLGVLGGLSTEAAASAAGEYRALGLAFLAPDGEVAVGVAPAPTSLEFREAYQAQSGGAPPGPIAVWAYEATNRLLDAVDAAVPTQGRPSRDGVLAALVDRNP